MKGIIYIIGLSVVLISCVKKQHSNNTGTESKYEVSTNLVLDNKDDNSIIEKRYFENVEDFKKFITDKKWVDLADENPCHEFSQSITIKDGYIYEYNTIEPSIYKVDTILQIDSKTLGIKIESNL